MEDVAHPRSRELDRELGPERTDEEQPAGLAWIGGAGKGEEESAAEREPRVP